MNNSDRSPADSLADLFIDIFGIIILGFIFAVLWIVLESFFS